MRTLQECADLMGISKSRAQQLEQMALQKLMRKLRNDPLICDYFNKERMDVDQGDAARGS